MIENKSDIINVWRAINMFTKSRQTIHFTSIAADTFNNHFLSASNGLAASSVNEHSLAISEKLRQFCESKLSHGQSFSIPAMTVFDVGKSISQLKNKRSFGHDSISTFFIKVALPYIFEPLTFIYNQVLQQGTYPNIWKKAKVIPLPKSKDLSDPNKFRPISLLSVISKPLEKHVHRHLSSFMETHGLYYMLQSGFRPNHSCHTALSHLTNSWLHSMNKAEMTGTLFLDLSKAFDLVNHKLLISKLQSYHVSSESVAFFESYLSNRSQYVFLNGKRSHEGEIKNGVPQGSILGPLLFSIFINDLPLHISCPNVRCSLFADDSTLDVSSRDPYFIANCLQSSLEDVAQWCKVNYMALNPSKTECMLITTRQKHQLRPPSLSLSLNSIPIKQVKEHRLLGVTVDEQLSWHAHLDTMCKTVSKNVFLLSRLTHLTDIHTRKLFYHAHIQSHIDYASTVWDGCSEACIKRLNSLHRRAVKLILPKRSDSTEQRMKDLGMLPLRKHLVYNKGIFMHRVSHSSAPRYLMDLFSPAASQYKKTRKSLFVPRPRIDIFKNSIAYSGAHLWNALPEEITQVTSISAFKAQLFRHLKNLDA